VTLVHKEDWDQFSGAVCNPFIWTILAYSWIELQDVFPHEDVVWGVLTLFLTQSISSPASAGIAYTIDPAYEAEVRDYLGQMMIFLLPTIVTEHIYIRL